MKTMNVLKWAAVFFAALLMSSCNDDNGKKDEKVPLNTQMIKEMQTKEFGTWHYFSFEKGKVVGTGSTDPKKGDDAKWKKRSDWDIAFNRYNIRTNGGVSGNGKGAVVKIEGVDFAGLAKAPTEGYLEDQPIQLYIAMPPKGPQDRPKVGMNPTTREWVIIKVKGPGSYDTKITPTLFVVKTANGKYVKLYMKNYKNAKGENGYLTFDYVYQKDGSTSF